MCFTRSYQQCKYVYIRKKIWWNSIEMFTYRNMDTLSPLHTRRVRGRVGLLKLQHVTRSAAVETGCTFQKQQSNATDQKVGREREGERKRWSWCQREICYVWWEVWYIAETSDKFRFKRPASAIVSLLENHQGAINKMHGRLRIDWDH